LRDLPSGKVRKALACEGFFFASARRDSCILRRDHLESKPVPSLVSGLACGDAASRRHRHCVAIMKHFALFCLAAWSAAALLYFGQHSVALIALSGVVALGGFDLLRPDSDSADNGP
jgi:hypothetical protein